MLQKKTHPLRCDARGLGLLVALQPLALILGVASNASACDFYAMFTNFGVNPNRTMTAQMSVSFETSGAPTGTNVLFTVYDAATGTQRGEFVVPVNETGFASTADAAPPNNNLFAITGNQPGLVRVRGPGSTSGMAWLEQQQKGSLRTRFVMSIPCLTEQNDELLSAGRLFTVALDDVKASALLITNPAGSPITVDVFHGTIGAVNEGVYTIPALQEHAVWRVDLQPTDEKKNLLVNASDPILVQLIIDDGRFHGLTCLPLD